MCASLTIELEQGTMTRQRHPHNGYFAGDFNGHRPVPGASPNEPNRHVRHVPVVPVGARANDLA